MKIVAFKQVGKRSVYWRLENTDEIIRNDTHKWKDNCFMTNVPRKVNGKVSSIHGVEET